MRQLQSFLLIHSCLLFSVFFTSTSRAADEIPNIINLPQAPPLLEKKEIAPEPSGVSVYSKIAPSVVLIICNTAKGQSSGTGSIISTDGLVLTNVHVIQGSTGCVGILKPAGFNNINPETPIYPLKVIALDPTKDLALVQFQTPIPGLKSIPIGQMSDIQIGQEVHAVGHPVGNFWSYTKGVISQVRLQERGIPPLIADQVQTQTPISPGNSGGPLVNNDGYLIGVNTWVRRDAQNINFAVAVSEVRGFIQRANRGENKPSPNPVALNPAPPNPAPSNPAPSNSAPSNPAPSNPGSSCKSRVIREEASQKIPGKVIRLDIGCTGQENAAMLIPDDSSRERILYISTKPPAIGGKIYFDIRYYVDQKTGKYTRSWYDVDRDGRPDYIGTHKTGGIEPTAYFFFNALSAE